MNHATGGAQCCPRIGQRTTYYTRGRKVSLCSKCLEAMLYAENHSAAPRIPRIEGDDELSRLASYYHP